MGIPYSHLDEPNVARPRESLYDVVLQCKPSDLCDEQSEEKRQWLVELPNGKEILRRRTKGGKAIGILGNFNRGKTWILSRLSEHELPNRGLTVKTNGLSLKWIPAVRRRGSAVSDPDEFYDVIIDTAGINSPIDLLDRVEEQQDQDKIKDPFEEKLHHAKGERQLEAAREKNFGTSFNEKAQETIQYEEFLQTMTLQLSDCIVVVMNETTFLDQKFLHEIVQKWMPLCETKTQDSLRRDKDVYVVHNFLRTTTREEMNTMFMNSTAKVYPGLPRMFDGDIPTFSCVQQEFRTKHICLMCDDVPIGKEYNDKVFDLLKTWMDSRVSQCGTVSPIDLVEQFCTSAQSVLIRGYLQNLKNLQPCRIMHNEQESYVFQAQKENKDEPIDRMKSVEDRLYGQVNCFVPPVSVSTYNSKDKNKKCRAIYMEIPGVDPKSIEIITDYKGSFAGHCAIQVKGYKEKKGLVKFLREAKKVAQKPDLVPNEENPDVIEGESDSCCYGEICKTFQIPLEFETKPCKVSGRDGTLFLLFKERDDKADSSSDDEDK